MKPVKISCLLNDLLVLAAGIGLGIYTYFDLVKLESGDSDVRLLAPTAFIYDHFGFTTAVAIWPVIILLFVLSDKRAAGDKIKNGHLLWVSGDGVKTMYSPYHELEQRSDDGKVLARAVVTLGEERVPPNDPDAERAAKGIMQAYGVTDLNQIRRDGYIEHVLEVYFINTSNAPIELTAESASMEGIKKQFDQTTEIAPHQWFITPPIISFGLNYNYGVIDKVGFTYVYNGKHYKINDKAMRLTVEAVNKKYSGKH
ncbi:MAG: hypothetical protein ACU836_11440 [Gammaproteobacteria bacterium]